MNKLTPRATSVVSAALVAALAGSAPTQAAEKPIRHFGNVVAGAATSRPVAPPGLPAPQGMVQDWSNNHVIYANPDTAEEAARKGQTAQWRRNYQDPRFVLALMRKLDRQSAGTADAALVDVIGKPVQGRPDPVTIQETIHRDWSNVVGGGANGNGGVGLAGVYPAKYNFSITADPSCANDFVVFPTGANGANDSVGATQETWVINFTANATGSIVLGNTAPRSVTVTASNTLNTVLNFLGNVSTTVSATNLQNAINRWSGQTGLRALASGSSVTITSNTVGDVPDALVTLTAPGGFAAGTHTNGSGSTFAQPTIIAFNQLYNGLCPAGIGGRANANAPNVYWAFNTGTGSKVTTSPVLSYYGSATQVAFVQSNGTTAELVLLKWAAGSGTAAAPIDLTAGGSTDVAAAAFRTCTAPCMTRLTLGADDSFSSPYMVYGADILWVGDNAGKLHKFTHVFRTGTPAEQGTVAVPVNGFPATVSGNALSSPVYNFANSQVMVGSGGGAAFGGRFHRVATVAAPGPINPGDVTSSAELTPTNANPGVRSGPLVDGTNGFSYVFIANDRVATCQNTNVANSANCRAVIQFANLFGSNTAGTKKTLGVGATTTRVQYNGAFDNAYYASLDGGTGNLYVCANDTGSAALSTTMTLYKIPLLQGAMQAPVKGAAVSATASTGDCSPVTTIFNGTKDYVYFSVPDHATDGAAAVCGTGAIGNACLFLYDPTNLDNLQEIWTLSLTNQPISGETMVVNASTLIAGTNYAIGSNKNQTATNIATAANLISGTTGITAVGLGGSTATVTFTRTAFGNFTDPMITEAMSNTTAAVTQQGSSGGSTWATTNVPFAGLSVQGGTSALIMDNISNVLTFPGAAQVYFMNLTQPGNATQTSQSGLQ
jgi:hypothetical protein